MKASFDVDRHYKHLNDLFLSNAPDERTARENWDFQKGIAEGLQYAMQSVLEQEGKMPDPKVLTLEELEAMPRLSIVWIEYWDGELQGPGKTLLAGMKCYDGTIVDEDGSTFSDFEDDMKPGRMFDGSYFRFWNMMPTEEQRKAVPWE